MDIENKIDTENTENIENTENTENTEVQEETSTENTKIYTIKVDGEERALTLDQLKEYASKSLGADKKFQEASELRKKTERESLAYNSMLKVVKGESLTDEDAEVLAQSFGGKPEYYKMAYSEVMNKGKEKDDNYVSENDLDDIFNSISKEKNDYDRNGETDMSDELKKKIEEIENKQNELLQDFNKRSQDQFINFIRNEVEKSVDKDEYFGKILTGNEADKLKKEICSLIFEKVATTVMSGKTYGDDVLNLAVNKTKDRVKNLGIRSDQSNESNLSRLPITGLGPNFDLSDTADKRKDAQEVDAASGKYEDEFLKNIARKAASMTGFSG